MDSGVSADNRLRMADGRRLSELRRERGAALIEFGSGSSTKTRIVLSAAKSLGAYVPVDISAQFLQQQAVGRASIGC